MAYNVIKISQPVLIMKKKVTISRAPHRGSINFPTNTSVKTSTTTYNNIISCWPDILNQKKYLTSQKWISKKQCVKAVHSQKCGGLK